MSYAIYAVLSAVVCWKWGNWRNWREYYPTILFFIMGNLAQEALMKEKELWEPWGILHDYEILEVSVYVVLYASIVILFFTFYNRLKTKSGRFAYVVLWGLIFSLMEFLSWTTGHFLYFNGWIFPYSIIFNLVIFPILLLHYKKTPWAWAVSIVCVYLLLFLFGIPLRNVT